MMLQPRLLACLACSLFLSLAAQGAEPLIPEASQVQAALHELDQWLADSGNGKNWQTYLDNQSLRAQLNSDKPAEPGPLRQALARYAAKHPGLELPRFTRVRQAVQRWLDRLEGTDPGLIPELITQAKTNFHPFTTEDVATTLTALRQDLATLDQFMVPGSKIRAAWRDILRSDELDNQLKSPDALNPQLLDEIAVRYHNGDPALNLPPFRAVAARLETLIQQLRVARDAQAPQTFGRALDALQSGLAIADQATPQQEATLLSMGRAAQWLRSRGQADDVVTKVRRVFAQPNAFVQISADVVTRGGRMQVNRSTPIRDVILGTCIVGSGRTIGVTDLQLVPSFDRGALDLVFHGATNSRTTGYNGPVAIGSRSRIQLTSRKRIYVDGNGILEQPAETTARMRTTTTGISTRFRGILGRIVTRVASRKVAQVQGQAERLGARKAERQFGSEFNQEAGSRVTQASHNFLRKIRRPLSERRIFPEVIGFQTTRDHLFVTLLETAPTRLAATSPPPALHQQSAIAARIHESAFNNFAYGLLAGRTITNSDIEQVSLDLLGEIPEALAAEEAGDRWSITFDPQAPVEVRFNDNVVSITMRGTQYTRNDSVFEQPMNVSAVYEFAGQPPHLRLARRGDIVIEPPGYKRGSGLGLRQTTLRNLLKRRFDKVFTDQIEIDGVTLPGAWANVGTLLVNEFSSQSGWFTLAWRARPNSQALASQEPIPLRARNADHVAAR
jgi:hypothetical protein